MVGTAEEFLYLHLALQLHHAVHDGLGTRGTARDKYIHRHNLIDTLHYMVARLERTSRDGAAAHSDDILGFCHLIIKTFKGRGHLVGDSAGAHDKVGLTGRVTCYLETETGEVVTGTSYSHKLDTAATGSKGERPK